MKPADVVMILVGLGGLALGGYALYRAQMPSLNQGPIAAAQPGPVATVTVPKAAPPVSSDLGNDVKQVLGDTLAFIDGLGGAVDSLGKFFDRF